MLLRRANDRREIRFGDEQRGSRDPAGGAGLLEDRRRIAVYEGAE